MVGVDVKLVTSKNRHVATSIGRIGRIRRTLERRIWRW